jgi:4a-hydroxytetrahydrobiopterin dehydratase
MWKETDKQLTRTLTFKNFREAFSFMTEVAFIAESLNHHPSWNNTFNKVSFALSTHDAGDTVTQKDYDLAAAIDQTASRYGV